MIPSYLSLFPPIIVIVTACVTQHLNMSLVLGIISAVLIATNGDYSKSVELITYYTHQQIMNPDNFYLYIFLIAIPCIIILLNKGNGPKAFTCHLTRIIHTPKGAQYASIFSSFVLSIDDYLSILTNGHIMRSLTDHYNIPRVKLAYLVHALSGTVVILSPISSWVATITACLHQSGISTQLEQKTLILGDPFNVYLYTLPYIFYSLLTITGILFIVKKNISFGPMHAYENNLEKPLFYSDYITPAGSLAEIFIPLLSLFTSIIVGILYYGKFWIFGGHNSFFQSFKSNNDIFLILAIGGVFSFFVTFIVGYIYSTITLKEVPAVLYNGSQLMKQAIIMVFLASILSLLLRNNVMTGQYLAWLCIGNVPLFLLPSLFFILSVITSIATGSSWGTFSLMIPIAIPMLMSLLRVPSNALAHSIPLLYPLLGAIFSGALCGDHISPFSETTLMASASTQIKPMIHVYTQLPYAIPVIIGTLISFIVSGILPFESLWINSIICLSIGTSVSWGLLLLAHKRQLLNR